MKDFLLHVQKSVFEGKLRDARVVQLRRMIQKVIDPVEDTVRIYHLCQRCIPATKIIGVSVDVAGGDEDEVL